MESLAQLNADFWLITFALLLSFSWILAIAGLWVFFRACRDLQSISESLRWIAHATLAPDRHVETPRRPAPAASGVISTSAFGR